MFAAKVNLSWIRCTSESMERMVCIEHEGGSDDCPDAVLLPELPELCPPNFIIPDP